MSVKLPDCMMPDGAEPCVGYQQQAARIAELEAELSKVRAERDEAERALLRHGYRKSCSIPACNCGDQWNHGGHAAERLREIADEVYVNGQTALQSVRALLADRDRLQRENEELRKRWRALRERIPEGEGR